MTILDTIEASEVPNEETQQPKEPTEPTPMVEDKEDEWISKFNALTAKEKSILKQEKELKATRDSYSQYEKLKQLASTDPTQVLEHFNINLDQLAEYFISQQTQKNVDPAVKALQDEIKAMKEEKLNNTKAQQEQAQEKAVNEFKSYIKEQAKITGAELVELNDATDMVYDLCVEYYEKNGKELDVGVAVQKVEKYLEKQAETYLKANKIKNKLKLTTAAPAPATIPATTATAATPETPVIQQSKTLSNDMSTSSASSNTKLSEAERLKKAAAFLK